MIVFMSSRAFAIPVREYCENIFLAEHLAIGAKLDRFLVPGGLVYCITITSEMDCNERNGTSEMDQIASSKGLSTLTVIQIQSIDGISSGMGQIASSEMDPRLELGREL
jgi:hypothetical protein